MTEPTAADERAAIANLINKAAASLKEDVAKETEAGNGEDAMICALISGAFFELAEVIVSGDHWKLREEEGS